MLLELGLIVTLGIIGCRRRARAVAFLVITAVFLMVFAVTVGNPIGLLASGGGWIILDTALFAAVLVSVGIGWTLENRPR